MSDKEKENGVGAEFDNISGGNTEIQEEEHIIKIRLGRPKVRVKFITTDDEETTPSASPALD
ncbi:MAG: hypothetical protein KDI11_00675 [Alphaproteobacteria bacterium]|nr:hypothetical protein [Alphaproteobacteria bacterium]